MDNKDTTVSEGPLCFLSGSYGHCLGGGWGETQLFVL